MFIQLMHRHYGVHDPIKHLEIPCNFNDVYLSEDHINEQLLLANIPDGWLPCQPRLILLTVADKYGTTGQRDLKMFLSWAKYFDAYVLELHDRPLDWWAEE